MSAALEGALATHFGRPRHVVELQRQPSPYATSFTIEDLVVRFDDGESLRLVRKDLGPASLLPAARSTKPILLYEPQREIDVYRRALADVQGPPTCYGTVIEPARGWFWLFLEKIDGVELYQVGDESVWEEVATWLAGLHEALSSQVERLGAEIPLLVHDGDYFRLWLRRAEQFAGGTDKGRLARLTAGHDGLVDRLLDLPVTMIHGEFYASNVLVAQGADGQRVAPVDWEMAAVGSGLFDLAALATNWPEPQRRRFVSAYRSGITAAGGKAPALDDLHEALRCCQLQQCLQWLGWAPGWSPPVEHSRDWLSEAVALSEELGL